MVSMTINGRVVQATEGETLLKVLKREKIDVIVDATYTKILKPDARAYLDCANELGVKTRHCVFVDDQQRNVKGAQAVGMNTVQFDVREPGRSFEQALSMLNEITREPEHA